MASEIREKPDKIVGYVLLAAGLVVVIVPVYFAMSVLFLGSSVMPEIIEAPTVSFDAAKISVGNETVFLPISGVDVNGVMEKLFLVVDVGLFFVVAVILISAGSVLMGKGVRLIREVKVMVVRERDGESAEVNLAGNGGE